MQFEVLLAQPSHEVTLLVRHRRVHDDEVHRRPERRTLGLRVRAGGRQAKSREDAATNAVERRDNPGMRPVKS